MSDWLEILLLAVASAFWPTLILVVVVALRLDHPTRILAFFVAGALLTTVSIGLAIVFTLDDTTVAARSNHSASAAVYLVAGGLSLLAAAALWWIGGGRGSRSRRGHSLRWPSGGSSAARPSHSQPAWS